MAKQDKMKGNNVKYNVPILIFFKGDLAFEKVKMTFLHKYTLKTE